MDKSSDVSHIESQDEVKPQIMGNVKLLQGGETVLVPTPSPDPNGKKDTTSPSVFKLRTGLSRNVGSTDFEARPRDYRDAQESS